MNYLTQEDFSTIEKKLETTLPEHYKSFHLEAKELIKTMREGDVWSGDDSIYLATDAEWIVMFNSRMGHPKSEGPVRNKLCIGSDGCGNFYFMNIDDPTDTRVYFTDHDGYDWEEIFDEELNDFKWEHEGLNAGASLEEFVKEVSGFGKE